MKILEMKLKLMTISQIKTKEGVWIDCISYVNDLLIEIDILNKINNDDVDIQKKIKEKQKKIKQMQKDFGSYDVFKMQFTEAAINVDASGWCLLVWEPRFQKLEILQCENHQNLTLWGCIPIFVLDMWEHSYYLQYQTKRTEYVNAFWNIVNWNEVNKRFQKISQ